MMTLLFLLLMAVSSSVLGGAVLMKLWAWFIVPAFGVTALTLPLAIGIMVIVRYLTYQYMLPSQTTLSESEKLRHAFQHVIGLPLGTLLIGWIVHLFM